MTEKEILGGYRVQQMVQRAKVICVNDDCRKKGYLYLSGSGLCFECRGGEEASFEAKIEEVSGLASFNVFSFLPIGLQIDFSGERKLRFWLLNRKKWRKKIEKLCRRQRKYHQYYR